jgi:hypothetical protein
MAAAVAGTEVVLGSGRRFDAAGGTRVDLNRALRSE